MTQAQISQSGTSGKLPTLLCAPILLPYEQPSAINELFCYVIKHYGTSGISCLIQRNVENDQVAVILGDWKGNKFNPTNPADSEKITSFMRDYAAGLLSSTRLLGLKQAQFFIATESEPTLVDVQLNLNKFVGPGYIADIFGKIMKTQEVTTVAIIDANAREAIKANSGSYNGNVILKPSKFRMAKVANGYTPLYVEVRR